MSLPQEKIEQRVERSHLKIQELSISLERLDHEYNKILAELGLTCEQLHSYAQNANNFSSASWDKLQTEKKQLDEKLNLSLKNIKDPLKMKKTFSERSTIQSHWLFVR